LERHVPPALNAIETQRLVGTPIGPGDLDFLCTLLGDPRVGATLGGTRDPAQVEELVAQRAREWTRGYGYRVWRERATGAPVARGGLGDAVVEGEPMVELGWAVLPARWGEGIATELAAASVAEAAGLGIPRVVAFTLPHNVASRRVMEKLGMRYDRVFEHGPWGPHVLYLLDTDAARRDG
jgi:RimJ/RimL family protein N-acetyltransferase